MEDETKLINIGEFCDKGYLQELNRRFLNPLGLALLVLRSETGHVRLFGIADCREDNEGFYFDVKNFDEETKNEFKINKDFIDNEMNDRCEKRKKVLGYDIEPID